MAARFKVAVVGLGYFSRFHVAAWIGNPDADLIALCDSNATRLEPAAAPPNVLRSTDLDAVIATQPDIIDIAAPPAAHAALIRASLAPGRTIICQKPFCTSLAEAVDVIATADAAETQIVIHENFRFQPWHRDIQAFLESGRMGRVFQARFDLRPGDGRGPRAYLDRQPSFQTMPRLLIHETGVHFIDLFRWLFGDIIEIYADTRRLNPVIAGEDAGFFTLHHASGVQSTFDGNRLSDHVTDNPRRTMGEMLVEGEAGALALGGDGRLSFRPFGSQMPERVPLSRAIDDNSFGGGCVQALIDHVVDALKEGRRPDNTARDYLHVMQVVEAAYQSAASGQRIEIPQGEI